MEQNLAQLLYEELSHRKIEIGTDFAGHLDKRANMQSDEDKVNERTLRDMVTTFADIVERDGKRVEFGTLSMPDSTTDCEFLRHKNIFVRRIKKYDIETDKNVIRWDITYNVRQ